MQLIKSNNHTLLHKETLFFSYRVILAAKYFVPQSKCIVFQLPPRMNLVVELFQDPEDFEELLQYFRRFKAYDVLRFYQFEATSLLIWGLLILAAGLLDYMISRLLGINGPNGISWLFITIIGVITDWFLGKSVSLSPFYRPKGNSFLLAFWMLGLWGSITTLIVFSLFQFIMPVVGIIIGLLLISVANQKPAISRDYFLPPPIRYIPSLASFLSTIVNLILLIIRGNDSAIYHGIVFGVLVGLSTGFVALSIQKRIETVDLDQIMRG